LDQIASHYLFLSERAMAVVDYLVLVAGGVLGWQTWDGEGRLRRIPYFLATLAILLVISMSHIVWLGSRIAADGSELSLLFVVSMGILLTGGYLTWVAAAARSRDIGGDPSRAPLAFVPFACFCLFFKAPEVQPDRTVRRRWFARGVGELAVVIFAAVLIAAASSTARHATRAIEQVSAELQAEHPAVTEAIEARLRTEGTIRRMADEVRIGLLPYRVDAITELVEISAQGDALVYEYRVDTDLDDFGQQFATDVSVVTCEEFGAVFEVGGRVVQRFARDDGHVVFYREADGVDCGWQAAPS
jgi:hypothetical protein